MEIFPPESPVSKNWVAGFSPLEKTTNFKGQSSLMGFTYIELLITLVIISVLFIPIMQLFSGSLYSARYVQDVVTATSLAKWEMERTKNLAATKEQLKKLGDSIYPATEEPPLLMNGGEWRIKREIVQPSDPLEVRVKVYDAKRMEQPATTLVTLIEDTTWEKAQP